MEPANIINQELNAERLTFNDRLKLTYLLNCSLQPFSQDQRLAMSIQKDDRDRIILIISDTCTHSYLF